MEEMDFSGWQGREWHREAKWGFMQARRGDMRPILLRVLKARPMHGYEIIRHLEEKSHGMWRPSPGSVYPTLQLLEEEDLVRSTEEGGKKVYELTVKGKKEAEAAFEGGPWMHHDKADLKKLLPLRKATAELIHTQRRAVKQALKTKDYTVVEQIILILKDAQRKVEAINSSQEKA